MWENKLKDVKRFSFLSLVSKHFIIMRAEAKTVYQINELETTRLIFRAAKGTKAKKLNISRESICIKIARYFGSENKLSLGTAVRISLAVSQVLY